MTAMRTRWAAIGAAVAVTLGVGGIGLVSATSPSGAAAFVPIEPCRVADTRVDFNVGPRATPLGADDTHTIAAHGDNGECVGIPSSATGLLLNVTALGATAPTFLTVWANSGGDRPLASSLNPAPDQPPVPNAVATQVSASGEFNIFNKAGAVDVIVDINGYYTDHGHDDRYPTDAEVDAKIAAASIGGVPGPQGPAGADGAAGADGSDLFDRTIVVNGGGTPAANGAALVAAVAEVMAMSPTASDPWTVLLEPGLFELTSRDIAVPDHVTIAGSGIEATTIASSANLSGQSMLEFGIGELRNLSVEGTDQFYLVEATGSLRVESVRMSIDESTSALYFNGGTHVVVDSEFFVTASLNGFAIRTNNTALSVRGSSFTGLSGTSVELIFVDSSDVVIDHSTFDGTAIGVFACCSSSVATLKVRHTAMDLTRRAIVSNLGTLDAEIESSTLIGVATSDIVALSAGGDVVVRGSTVVGGGVGSTGTATCRGTTTETGFLSSTCP